MTTITLDTGIVEDVLKEVFWLAWQASSIMGSGFLQNIPGATKEGVWQNAMTNGDYPGQYTAPAGVFSADYVFGRMMKLTVWVEDGNIKVKDEPPRPDYQSWCSKYPTYETLIEAAKTNVIGAP